jgi:ribonuclease P protein component
MHAVFPAQPRRGARYNEPDSVGAEAMDRRAGKTFRVTRRDDIRRLFEQGRRASDRRLTLYAAPNGLPRSRAGVAVSAAKHGNAVRRNRLKRLCREAFRLIRSEIPAGWDYMVVPRAAADHAMREIQASLKALVQRVTGGETTRTPVQ